MKLIWQHIAASIFVAAAAAAAYTHSTWALSTFFGGLQPVIIASPAEGAEFIVQLLRYIAWVTPGALLAFAIDVGQLATAHNIRKGGAAPSMYVTFFVLSLITYYLQWLYMAVHFPYIELGPGVRLGLDAAILFRDAAIWFIPALLPAAMILYTIGSSNAARHDEQAPAMQDATEQASIAPAEQKISIRKPEPAMLEASAALELYTAYCECGRKFTKATEPLANRALAAHKGKGGVCKVMQMQSEGNNEHHI